MSSITDSTVYYTCCIHRLVHYRPPSSVQEEHNTTSVSKSLWTVNVSARAGWRSKCLRGGTWQQWWLWVLDESSFKTTYSCSLLWPFTVTMKYLGCMWWPGRDHCKRAAGARASFWRAIFVQGCSTSDASRGMWAAERHCECGYIHNRVGWAKASIIMSPAEASTIRMWLCSRCKNSLQRNLLSGLDP